MDAAGLKARLRGALLASLPAAPSGSRRELARLYDLLGAYPRREGKAVRGTLLLLSCRAHGGRWDEAMPVAVALELFQNWVLIHDDIEDGSEERRGEPALHRLAGMPVALNVGDLLHVVMWDALEEARGLPRYSEIRREVSRTIRRTAEGQHLDLSWVAEGRFDLTADDYLEMVVLKTAHYTVTAPLRLGALAADREPDPRLEPAGRLLGAAFQIRDDVLNLLPGDGYGKEFAGDLYEAKRTLILAGTFERASRAEREELTRRLGAPRERRTKEDVEVVLALIERHGALREAQGTAETMAQEGLALLRDALRESADEEAREELTGLLESLAFRSR